MPELPIDEWILVFHAVINDSLAPLERNLCDGPCLPLKMTREGRLELSKLSLVCRAWLAAITPLLWRSVLLDYVIKADGASPQWSGPPKGLLSHFQWVRTIWLSDLMSNRDVTQILDLLRTPSSQQSVEALLVHPGFYSHEMSSSILSMPVHQYENLRMLRLSLLGLSALSSLQPLQKLEMLSVFFAPGPHGVAEQPSRGLSLPSLRTLCVSQCTLRNLVPPHLVLELLEKCVFPSLEDIRLDLVLREMMVQDRHHNQLFNLESFFGAHQTIRHVGVTIDELLDVKALRHSQIPATSVRCEAASPAPDLLSELPDSVSVISFHNIGTDETALGNFRQFFDELSKQTYVKIKRLELCVVGDKEFRWKNWVAEGDEERAVFSLIQVSVALLKDRHPYSVQIVDSDGCEMGSM